MTEEQRSPPGSPTRELGEVALARGTSAELDDVPAQLVEAADVGVQRVDRRREVGPPTVGQPAREVAGPTAKPQPGLEEVEVERCVGDCRDLPEEIVDICAEAGVDLIITDEENG